MTKNHSKSYFRIFFKSLRVFCFQLIYIRPKITLKDRFCTVSLVKFHVYYAKMFTIKGFSCPVKVIFSCLLWNTWFRVRRNKYSIINLLLCSPACVNPLYFCISYSMSVSIYQFNCISRLCELMQSYA